MKPSLSPAASAGREMPWDALFMLLQTIALRYTKEESSSLPKELAEELLRSICYTLGPELAALPVGPLLPLYEAGVARTENAVRACRRRWQVARLSLPKTTSLSCRETLSSIGTFFQNYDARFFAHEIPCDIDYQLCLPVPETFLGVDYVSEYLSRLCIENDFLRLFPAERADALLMHACPDYRFRIDNLYSPVATNALGLALAGMEVRGLSVPAAACQRTAALLAPLLHTGNPCCAPPRRRCRLHCAWHKRTGSAELSARCGRCARAARHSRARRGRVGARLLKPASARMKKGGSSEPPCCRSPLWDFTRQYFFKSSFTRATNAVRSTPVTTTAFFSGNCASL